MPLPQQQSPHPSLPPPPPPTLQLNSPLTTHNSPLFLPIFRAHFKSKKPTSRVINLHFHWINLLILFGALQGLLFSVILFFNKTHPGAKFLSAFIFTLAYNGFETFNWSSGLDQYYLFFDMFGYVVIYALGPSMYLYVSSLLNPTKKFSKKTIAAHYGLVVFQFISENSYYSLPYTCGLIKKSKAMCLRMT